MVELINMHHQLRTTLDEAKSQCHTTLAMVRTAQEINRAAFRRQTDKPTVDYTYSYVEEQNAPVACEA